MTIDTDIPPRRRDGFHVSGLLVTLGIIAVVATVALGFAVSIDAANDQAVPDKLLYGGTTAAAALWLGVLATCLRDSTNRRIRESDRLAEDQRAEIELKLASIMKEVQDSRRQIGAGLIVLHDEVNAFAEQHTGEIKNLAEAIRAYGEERETEGELSGLREAAGGTAAPPIDRVRLRPVP